ncbi:MAG: hypothetical protein P9L93_04455 [Candidatus Gorgyraea atricola]|nr:hypothetical protein [Candidatus Gorgyraea atricola]
MIIKEKIIFLLLLVVSIVILIFGFGSQGKKKEATRELMKDIELATKKSKAKKKAELKDRWDFSAIKAFDKLTAYNVLLKRSPFFKVMTEGGVKKAEPIAVKVEKKEPIFKYKGKVTMGSKIMVVIEDQGTGKSFFAKEGDMVGDFLVSSIDEKEVVLKKRGGEELVLSAAKKEKKVKKEKKEEKGLKDEEK